MKQQRSGKIINVSSSTVFAGTPLFLHYVTSKALVGMTGSLAREVGDSASVLMRSRRDWSNTKA